MFNFQQNHELEDHHLISFVQSNMFPADSSSHPPPPPSAGRGKKRTSSTNDEKNNVKKISHREIEKQRRQDMAELHASLRSLLPVEYIKGKRSISDHMDQAVNYINNLQKNISQLRSKKETVFAKNPNLSTSSSGNAEGCPDRQGVNIIRCCSTVTLNLIGNELEILIKIKPKENEVFPISKMMKKMFSEGHNFTSYLCSKTHDDATLYSFISEVDDPSCIDIIRLQKTLMDMIMHQPTSI